MAVNHAADLLEGRDTEQSARNRDLGADEKAAPVLMPPEKSESERRREEGTKIFQATVIECAKRANEIDTLVNRYNNACSGQYSYGSAYGRDWFGVYQTPMAISNESLPSCRAWLADIYRLAGEIHTLMLNGEEKARRASVYPRVRRDIRRKYRMDWEGWGR